MFSFSLLAEGLKKKQQLIGRSTEEALFSPKSILSYVLVLLVTVDLLETKPAKIKEGRIFIRYTVLHPYLQVYLGSIDVCLQVYLSYTKDPLRNFVTQRFLHEHAQPAIMGVCTITITALLSLCWRRIAVRHRFSSKSLSRGSNMFLITLLRPFFMTTLNCGILLTGNLGAVSDIYKGGCAHIEM